MGLFSTPRNDSLTDAQNSPKPSHLIATSADRGFVTALTTPPPDDTFNASEVNADEEVAAGRNRVLYGAIGLTTFIAVAFAVLSVAWYVDENDRTALVRNVEVAGADIGDLEPAEARARIDTLQTELLARPATLSFEGGELQTTLGELGASIDSEAILAKASETGRDGVFPVRQFNWVGTFIGTDELALEMNVNTEALFTEIVDLGSELISNPIEPEITSNDAGEITVVPGATGYQVDPDAIAETINALQPVAQGPIVIPIERIVTEPTVSAEAAQAEVDSLLETLPTSMRVSTDAGAFNVPGEEIRSWVQAEVADGAIQTSVKLDRAVAAIDGLASPLVTSEEGPYFEVSEAGQVELIAGNALGCCGEEGTQQIFDAAMEGSTTAEVALVPTGEAGELYTKYASYGIMEEVSTYTTNYAPGQGRVTNIRHIADLTQGYVIEPGGYFSVNEYIGKRTREGGFVAAGVIYSGRYTEDVGGGISQYATTMFNAAYFAGLEFDEYQSHSLYISRYPYGREATLSFPAPDLKIRNDTPYGVLIWPTTTETSITVQMFSTEYYETEEAFQSTSKSGACTVVSSHRERLLIETGEVINDSTEAVYRPGQGLDCNGNETARVD